MCSHNYCVILAGGIGSRFWPISRESNPKQFLNMTSSGKSYIRLAYERMARTIPEDNIYVVSLGRYRDKVLEQLPELSEDRLLLEPYSRNTAPSIAFAAYSLLSKDPEAVMVVTPADHIIPDHDIFDKTLSNALEAAAEEDALYTIGVVPTRPDSQFGYIQVAGGSAAVAAGTKAKAKTFTEKPDAELAKVFVESGEFLWNTGIFIWKASVIKAEMEKHAPEITRLWNGWETSLYGPDRAGFLEKTYADSPRISIDYAVMEKSDKVWIFPGRFSWADIGNWESLYSYLSGRDSDGNASHISGMGLLKEDKNNIFYTSDSGKLTIIRGLENFVVVDTDDVLMICPRDERQLKDTLSEIAMPEYQKYK